MRRALRDPAAEFEELRRLLLSRERKQLRDLEDRISDKERRSHDVAGVLPEAVKLAGNAERNSRARCDLLLKDRSGSRSKRDRRLSSTHSIRSSGRWCGGQSQRAFGV